MFLKEIFNIRFVSLSTTLFQHTRSRQGRLRFRPSVKEETHQQKEDILVAVANSLDFICFQPF